MIFKSRQQSYLVLVAFIMLPAASKTIFMTFSCEEFDGGYLMLIADYSLDCQVDRHLYMVLYAYLMILIWPVGMPLTFYVLLYSNKEDIQRDEYETSMEKDPLEVLRERPIFDKELAQVIDGGLTTVIHAIPQLKPPEGGLWGDSDSDIDNDSVSQASTGGSTSGSSYDSSSDSDSNQSESDSRRSAPYVFGKIKKTNGRTPISKEEKRRILSLVSAHVRDHMDDEDMDMIDLFDSWDLDKNESLSKEEFRRALRKINLPVLSNSELDDFFSALDHDGDGYLTLDDFIMAIEFNYDNNPRLNGFTMLFGSYKPEVFYWELVVTARRVIITAALVAFKQGSVEQTVLGMITCMAAVVGQCVFDPHNTSSANETSLAAEVQLFMVLFAGLVLPFIEDGTVGDEMADLIGTCLVILFAVVMFIAFTSSVKEMLHDVIFSDQEEIKLIKKKARKGRRNNVLTASEEGGDHEPRGESGQKAIPRLGGHKVVPIMAVMADDGTDSDASDNEGADKSKSVGGRRDVDVARKMNSDHNNLLICPNARTQRKWAWTSMKAASEQERRPVVSNAEWVRGQQRKRFCCCSWRHYDP